jgi:hypothetical protein
MIDTALLLPEILARAGKNAELNETAAKIAWRRALGESLRDHAVASRLDENTLVVSVADVVWQKQLQAMSAELIFRVNKLLRQKVVGRLEFRIDPSVLRVSGKHRSTQRASGPLPANITSSAAAIEDPELRERFMRAAENCISRRESFKPQ